MSKFVVDTLQSIPCRRATLKYGTLFILGVVFTVIFFDKPNYEGKNRIVSDASSVLGSQEWMWKKEAEFEARRAHVREVCAKLNSKYQWASTEQRYFWFDIKHGIALCAHAKVWFFFCIQNVALRFKCSIVCLTLQKFKLLMTDRKMKCH